MKLLETLNAMEKKKKVSVPAKPEIQLDERAIDKITEQPTCIYGHKEGTKEYFDMVEELKFLKKHDPDLYKKIMSLD